MDGLEVLRNQNHGQNKHVVLRACVNSGSDDLVATKTFMGVDYVVVPIIALVEGVLHSANADKPALALASEFGLFPAGWNGRPVVFSHPIRSGQSVSANSVDVWETEVFGLLFNTALDGTKLKTEMWLEKSKVPPEVMALLDASTDTGTFFEVSTGLFTLEEEVSGTFNGLEYSYIWRNIVPDHLAVLPEGVIGACSVESGCGGPRVNDSLRVNMYIGEDMKTFTIKNCLPLLGLRTNELSSQDKMAAVETALNRVAGSQFSYTYVLALFDSRIIFAGNRKETSLDVDTRSSWGTYEASYSVEEGGKVTVGASFTEVRAETQFVPLIIESGQPTPAPTPAPTSTSTSSPAANMSVREGATKMNADNVTECTCTGANATSVSTSENVPAAMEATAGTPEEAVNVNVNAAATPQLPTESSGTSHLHTLSELLASATPEVQFQINEALEYADTIRAEYVTELTTNGKFAVEDLKPLKLSLLAKMVGALKEQGKIRPSKEEFDFSGNSSSLSLNSNSNSNSEADYTPARKVFEPKVVAANN